MPRVGSGSQQRRQQKRRPPKCAREGCVRTAPYGTAYCTKTCSAVAEEIQIAERLATVLGTPATYELYAAAVTLNDALTEYRDLDHSIHQAAVDVGMAKAQWRELKFGK